jgi:hypothetical protein
MGLTRHNLRESANVVWVSMLRGRVVGTWGKGGGTRIEPVYRRRAKIVDADDMKKSGCPGIRRNFFVDN